MQHQQPNKHHALPRMQSNSKRTRDRMKPKFDTEKTYGWKSTAFGAKYNHFFMQYSSNPLCGSTAIFTTAPRKQESKGNVCQRCEKQSEMLGFGKKPRFDVRVNSPHCELCGAETDQVFNIRAKMKAVCLTCERAIVKQSVQWRYSP